VSDDLPDGMTSAEVDALKHAAREQLRQRVAGLRRSLTAPLRDARAQAMCEALLTSSEFERARVIAFYMPLRFEIDPTRAMEHAIGRGQIVALPRVDPETNTISFHRYLPGDELVESGFMVREPVMNAQSVAFGDVDVVLVPGLAFDARGQRLGYGKGYYDRLLGSLRAWRIGLCFDFQLLVEIPSFPHDVAVDALVTDRRVLRCSK
jgi:5-formyltetrahydrofolate cyclo-ligase